MKLRFSVRWLTRLWLGLSISLLVSLPCAAQRVEVTDKDAEAVELESVSISTEVTGRIAVTTFDLIFHNPNPRVLEGTLLFPLLDGQRVVRFALDINGVLREAVPVEKSRGRMIFEDIERRGADPGLVEEAGGSVYRIRLYPLPAQGRRHVRLAYQEDLSPTTEQTTYRLNLDFPKVIKRFHLALNVHTGSSLPAQAHTTLDLQLPPWRDGQFMEMEREDFDGRGLFEIVLPKAERPRILTGRYQGKEYFYSEVPSTPLLLTRPAPKVVGLLWDSSASGRERNHEREYALLSAWFADLKNVEVRLFRIRDRVTREGTFSVNDGEWHTLQKELESTVYDGATSLDGLVDDSKVDAWILFSDGFLNYGTVDPSSKIPLHGLVHTVLSSTRANALWLRTVAANRGGEYVNLFESDPAKAVSILESQSTRVLGVEYNPEDVAQVFPDLGTPILGEFFPVTGILRKRNAKIRFLIGQNRENAQPVEITVLSGDDPSELAPRAWAVAKIERLSTDYRANQEDIRSTSSEFGIVTPDTSLLVLETVSDYLRYNVTPPDELREEWEARRPHPATSHSGESDHLETVVQAFEQRVEWWERKFPTDLPKKEKGGAKSESPSPRNLPEPALPPELGDAETDHPRRPTPSNTSLGFAGGLAPSPLAASLAGFSAPSGFSEQGGETPPNPEITLQRWSPQSGYVDHLRRSPTEHRYGAYLEERTDHVREPGFYLDCADFFFENADADTALRILSNLAELELDDPALLRVLAYRLLQANRPDLAAPVLERVLALRPEEPQSRRDLALAYSALGKFQRAVDLLWEIVSRSWDTRFPDVELIALEELNAIVATCNQNMDLSRIDPRLRKNLPLDLRVVLSWDANDCDIDLWVVDPNGQTAKYDFPLTYQGGQMSHDFTGGYGPEEFLLHTAKPGLYGVKINYYGDRRQTALGPVTAQVRLITGFGTPRQQEKRLTVRLKNAQETLEIGNIEIAGRSEKSRK